jgi:hypothetical protein
VKNPIVRGTMLFAAGALSATVVAMAGGLLGEKKPMSAEEWQKKANPLLVQIADLGSRVAMIEGKRLGINENPPIECVSPPNPTIAPPGVNPVSLRRGMDALAVLNQGYEKGQKGVVYGLTRCWTTDP